MNSLKYEQILKRLHPLMLAAFRLDELQRILQNQMTWKLPEIPQTDTKDASAEAKLHAVVLAVIQYANGLGQLLELVEVLGIERPGLPEFSELLNEMRAGETTRAGDSTIFVSYAWGDNQTPAGVERQLTVDQLCAKLKSWGWQVRRDNTELKQGEIISEYMKRLGRGDRIVVILSEKYLRSQYCMAELHYIYQRSLGDQQEFLKRVVPMALADARFSTPEERLEHARHWRGRHDRLKADWELLGSRDQQLLKDMNRWSQEIGDMLAFVNDSLIPRNFKAICQNDFHALREMLQIAPNLENHETAFPTTPAIAQGLILQTESPSGKPEPRPQVEPTTPLPMPPDDPVIRPPTVSQTPTVFVAPATPDQNGKKYRKAIVDALRQPNTRYQTSLRILPSGPYPIGDLDAYRAALDRDLAESHLFVQVLGDSGTPLSNGTPFTFEGLQFARAKAKQIPCLRWRPDGDELLKDIQEFDPVHYQYLMNTLAVSEIPLLENESVQPGSLSDFCVMAERRIRAIEDSWNRFTAGAIAAPDRMEILLLPKK
ncbi:MAG: toll/interleukin-1 receptor domain-containing protein, partial [Planctomycetota bacterium]|nr:toll/interleukin-1 receptor domain-containing protein [Planctomycetota bacterium]